MKKAYILMLCTSAISFLVIVISIGFYVGLTVAEYNDYIAAPLPAATGNTSSSPAPVPSGLCSGADCPSGRPSATPDS